ncbi:vanadium-dependent haloperoxidase [Pseudomonadota bacterium]
MKCRARNISLIFCAFLGVLLCGSSASAEKNGEFDPGRSPSVAREWNELLLDAIRGDFARPTVHARNLFHISAAMYDAWALFSDQAKPYLLGSDASIRLCGAAPDIAFDVENNSQEIAVSYAAYQMIKYRFRLSPTGLEISDRADTLMKSLGYDIANHSTVFKDGAAEVGNYIANCYIKFGLSDHSNEGRDHENRFYKPINPVLDPEKPGNPDIIDLDRWQPLHIEGFIGQAGHLAPGVPDFLSPEWGRVTPFSLSDDDLTIYKRKGNEYWVYHDPGAPPLAEGKYSDEYKWGFALVSIWSAHLTPDDGVMIDISPASNGNVSTLPDSIKGLRGFYNEFEGGDIGKGHPVNPATGKPYEPNIVPRGDYARVLAEFWADGPDSETPPGHWYVLLNEVSDHEDFEKKYKGEGKVLTNLEWDVKAYFALGGAMHDSAIAAWGIKGHYDYIRPVSAIRSMADHGQSANPDLPSYSQKGIPLIDGYIELVKEGDKLAGQENINVGKLKLYTWKGPDYISSPLEDEAGVGWILAENWWPYQRPSFVTPPFAGYVSGHSTYSRAAAELLTRLTGSKYFPGGMGRFTMKKDEYLVFEDGPSQDVELQWATYQDASDQCSLSRIWGGIHPPADDIPGRLIGKKIGMEAFVKADSYFHPAE